MAEETAPAAAVEEPAPEAAEPAAEAEAAPAKSAKPAKAAKPKKEKKPKEKKAKVAATHPKYGNLNVKLTDYFEVKFIGMVINRPGVAGAVLQSASLLID